MKNHCNHRTRAGLCSDPDHEEPVVRGGSDRSGHFYRCGNAVAVYFLYPSAAGPVHPPAYEVSVEEAHRVLSHLTGTPWLMASLLYGAGLRLLECCTLRVKDLDFDYYQITVRDGKGHKDRLTILPASLIEPLQRHLIRVKKLHETDLSHGFGRVNLPDALARKYPRATTDWGWQYVFPSATRSPDRETGIVCRFHTSGSALQKAVKQAIKAAGITKQARL